MSPLQTNPKNRVDEEIVKCDVSLRPRDRNCSTRSLYEKGIQDGKDS